MTCNNNSVGATSTEKSTARISGMFLSLMVG